MQWLFRASSMDLLWNVEWVRTTVDDSTNLGLNRLDDSSFERKEWR
jgi:hypothetical protein